jgi:hypothetical protein
VKLLPSLACAAALLLSLSASSAARADDDTPPAPKPAATSTYETSWYGWQTLAADAGSLGVGAALSGGNGSAGLVAALTGYALAAPTVHAAHGNWGTAGGDLALRVGTPVVAGLVGYGIGAATFHGGCAPDAWFCGRDWSGVGGAVVGIGAGMLTAVVLDATLLGHERVRRDEPDAAPTAVRWSPQVAVSPKGEPSVGVAGSF